MENVHNKCDYQSNVVTVKEVPVTTPSLEMLSTAEIVQPPA